MTDDIVERLRSLPPREICEHGSQKVKCPECECVDLERRVSELEEQVAAARASAFEEAAKIAEEKTLGARQLRAKLTGTDIEGSIIAAAIREHAKK